MKTNLELNRWTLQKACFIWNNLTSPSVMRTDREHALCRKAARKVRQILDRWPSSAIREFDSGRIYPA